jgi:UPF0271 protein
MPTIDLNCDMGEGCGNDQTLLDLVSSANIACGFHAGDPSTMRRTADAAVERGVAIGAHPSFADRENFGRSRMSLSPREVFDIVLYQVAAMSAICESAGAKLHHVKPHGALYNQSANDPELASAIAEAVRTFDPNLVLYALSGGQLIEAGKSAGLKTASEAFADRTYTADGRLTPRSQPNALITDRRAALDQVLRMIEFSEVVASTGETVRVSADTICIHGDGETAVEFARTVRSGLSDRGIQIATVHK